MIIFVASCSGDNKKTENAEVQTQQQEVEKSKSLLTIEQLNMFIRENSKEN